MNKFAKAGIIKAEDLAALPGAGEAVKIIDATYIMPGSGISGRDLYESRRIDGAVYFDIDAIADRSSPLPHMLPSPDEFSRAVSALGIGNDDFIVVYDQSGIAMAAARVWWTFRVFGHDNICVLDGGLPYWMATGHEIAGGEPSAPASEKFTARFRPELVKGLPDLEAAMGDETTLILDARGAERFNGTVEEPRPGLRSGHIPGSRNLPFASLINPADGRLKDISDLQASIGDILPPSTRPVASCGSGVTACVIALACYRLGKNDVAVYDGSWVEWGQETSGTEVATGPEM